MSFAFFNKKQDTPPKPQKKETVWSILGVIIFALFLKATVLTIFIIPSGSMIPTLKVGDVLIVNRLYYGISNPLREAWYSAKLLFVLPNPWFQTERKIVKQRFWWDFGVRPRRLDIVIFKVPLKPQPEQEYVYQIDGRDYAAYFALPGRAGMDYVKRCIGLPGDVVELRNGRVLINGEYLSGQDDFSWVNDFSYYGPLKVPEGHYFVLGDNRPNSSDSRFWGFVPEDHLVGVARFVALPPWRWKILK
ncbi:MAG: signal peptidase I [Candidatus Margulisbacteria bacterium]|jgi:signal peptidase I|nr:signal peptidase I [Candidatus Margulisiibacteriota bacterium]